MKLNYLLIVFCFLFIATTDAQLNLNYQKPAQEILDLAQAPLPPAPMINDKSDLMLLLYRNQFRSIEEMCAEELKLAGRRINPKTNMNSRTRYYNNVKLMKVGEKDARQVIGLPQNLQMANMRWSPDQTKVAFTNTVEKGAELWLLDIKTASCKKLTEAELNGNLGSLFIWAPDGKSILFKSKGVGSLMLEKREDQIPTGPRVSVNDGAKAQNRTYQDLLKNKVDEDNFEKLSNASIIQIDLNGVRNIWLPENMYRGISYSPNGEYIMVTTMSRPFSYIVPYYRFPTSTAIYSKDGQLIKEVNKTPLIEELPKGFGAVYDGKRNMSWRSDKGAALYWVKSLDKGDPAMEVDYRDEVFTLDAPFNSNPSSLIKTKNRYSYIQWGTDKMAIAYDYQWKNRNRKAYLFNPIDNQQSEKIIQDINTQDRYNDPGRFVTEKNHLDRYVLQPKNGKLILRGTGHSPEGIRGFIDEYDIISGTTKRLWRVDGKDNLEKISDILNIENGTILTRIESSNEYPNYYIRNFKEENNLKQITFFENPFKAIQDVHKEVIKYKRADGVDLSGTLYLPTNYTPSQNGTLPMIMWAYPQEFKDKKSAGQVTSSEHEFAYPYYGSPLYWVARGYVVLEDAAFPIIGEGDEEPNDSFIEQLVANGKAGIDAVDELGYIDRNKVAVGGHSYGAFMTANLLSHSNLFAAGIARSGAYNRTLTPFGFQAEERSYWDAPNIYYEMSPFMHADKMKTPLLLIHGEEDNNSGTYPLQSERYFNALKGLGATVRLVILPKESHGYAAKESIMHLLWEQDQWLEKYVKNREIEKQ